MIAIYRSFTKIANIYPISSKYVRKSSNAASGSNFNGTIVTSDYQKYGNYFQRDHNRHNLEEYKNKFNWCNQGY